MNPTWLAHIFFQMGGEKPPTRNGLFVLWNSCYFWVVFLGALEVWETTTSRICLVGWLVGCVWQQPHHWPVMGWSNGFSSISSGSFLRVPEHGINLKEDGWFIILALPLRFPFLWWSFLLVGRFSQVDKYFCSNGCSHRHGLDNPKLLMVLKKQVLTCVNC